MKKSGIVLMLGVSVLMASGAAVLARSWLEERTVDQTAEADESAVVAATTRIPFGQTVRVEDLRMVTLPPEAIPPNSFDNRDNVVGRVAAETLYPGEVVLEERVVEHLGGSALGAVLEKGKRAITVRVDDVAGVAGFILPDNRVDVLATRRTDGRRNVESETILRDIKVLAVDQKASQEGEDGPMVVRAVTLEVTPPQAERVTKAASEGSIQLTLRNPTDSKIAASEEEEAEEEQVKKKEREKMAAVNPTSATTTTDRGRTRRQHISVTVIRGMEASSTTVHDHGADNGDE